MTGDSSGHPSRPPITAGSRSAIDWGGCGPGAARAASAWMDAPARAARIGGSAAASSVPQMPARTSPEPACALHGGPGTTIGDLGVESIDAAHRLDLREVHRLGDDLALVLTPAPIPQEGP